MKRRTGRNATTDKTRDITTERGQKTQEIDLDHGTRYCFQLFFQQVYAAFKHNKCWPAEICIAPHHHSDELSPPLHNVQPSPVYDHPQRRLHAEVGDQKASQGVSPCRSPFRVVSLQNNLVPWLQGTGKKQRTDGKTGEHSWSSPT